MPQRLREKISEIIIGKIYGYSKMSPDILFDRYKKIINQTDADESKKYRLAAIERAMTEKDSKQIALLFASLNNKEAYTLCQILGS